MQYFSYLRRNQHTTAMSATRLYLDMRSKAKDGRGSVVITLAHNYTTATFSTGIRLLKSEWDGRKVINRDDAGLLNVKLAERKNEIDRKIVLLSMNSGFSQMTATQVKNQIGTRSSSNEKHLVSNVFAEYLERPMKDNTKQLFLATLKKIEIFAGKNLNIEDINYKWLVKFESFLSKTQSVNGRSIYLRSLRAVCNYARKIKLIQDYPFESFSIRQEQTMKRSVSIEKLRELYYFECKPHQVRYRDYFFLMFFLIGINAKDLFLAKPGAIINNRLEYIREKTYRKYSIKIEPEAAALLDKYKGNDYLVEVMDRCKDYRNYVHEMNDCLGQIGYVSAEEVPACDDLFGEPKLIRKIEPIIPDLTTYYARHTWATIAFSIGISTDIISRALGHSSGNRTTLIYIKDDPKQVDDANRKVIDYFFKKSGTENTAQLQTD